jgi:hypothetical protein
MGPRVGQPVDAVGYVPVAVHADESLPAAVAYPIDRKRECVAVHRRLPRGHAGAGQPDPRRAPRTGPDRPARGHARKAEAGARTRPTAKRGQDGPRRLDGGETRAMMRGK